MLIAPEFLANSVHEELDPATSRTDVHVEALSLDEEFSQLAKHSPIRSFVQSLRPDEVE